MDNQIQVEGGFDYPQTSGYWKYGNNQKHWALRSNIFIRSDFVLHPEIMLDKLYKGEMFIEVPKFRSNLFWELIWF